MSIFDRCIPDGTLLKWRGKKSVDERICSSFLLVANINRRPPRVREVLSNDILSLTCVNFICTTSAPEPVCPTTPLEMPISNKSSERQMTTTSIRVDPTEIQRREEMRKRQRARMTSNNNQPKTNDFNPSMTRKQVNTDNPPISVGIFLVWGDDSDLFRVSFRESIPSSKACRRCHESHRQPTSVVEVHKYFVSSEFRVLRNFLRLHLH